MSDAIVEVFTPGGKRVGYSAYQGSADIVRPGIHRDIEDWRGGDPSDWDRCEHELEPCIVYATYGSDQHWAAVYCPICLTIYGPLSPYPGDYGYDFSHSPDPGPECFDGHPFPDTLEEKG